MSSTPGPGPPLQQLSLGPYEGRVRARLEEWEREGFGRRLWAKDHTLWSPEPDPEIQGRLGWLELPDRMAEVTGELRDFAAGVRGEGAERVVLLGMGGSSLAPETFHRVLGSGEGFPELTVLDSVHPAAVAAAAATLDPEKVLFVVSSKSGGTLETLSLFHFFWQWMEERTADPGERFAAVTDGGSSLERVALERRFRRVFRAPSDVGGRFSALSYFGLVPAALIGCELDRLAEAAVRMSAACWADVPAGDSPGLGLGAALGELALAARDKVTLVTDRRLAAFPDWLEQLLAESTGKAGRGIVPVIEPGRSPAASYGRDRVFVMVRSPGSADPEELDALALELEQAGHPTLRIHLGDLHDLGGEMFRWQVATAAAGAVLGVQPFDQPDVQLAKDLTRRAMSGDPGEDQTEPSLRSVAVVDRDRLGLALSAWLASQRRGDYLAIQAFLAPGEGVRRRLEELQARLGARTGRAVTLGFGPRFLHSTGQLHKGGPDSGHFLQLVDDPAQDLPVPEADFTFGRLIRGQADGDAAALIRRGRRLLRVELGPEALAGLDLLLEAVCA